MSAPLGIYLHIPFCARRCDYCDFFVVAGGDVAGQAEGFFHWLRADLALCAGSLRLPDGGPQPPVDTIYFGGGTPSLVDPVEIERILLDIRRLFPVTDRVEVSLEANPESVTGDRARAWRAAGVNRLSLGVQSLDDAVLPRRGRLYDAAGAAAAVQLARNSGFDNLGIDLIAGLPGETAKGFFEGVSQVIGWGPEHVSVYLLETDDALKVTPLVRAVAEGRERLPEEEETVSMYAGAVDRLAAAGFRHYEISNFAAPGRESRHNLKYWLSDPYLGIGPSAHSNVGGRRFGRPGDMTRWIAQVREGLFAPVSGDYTLTSVRERGLEALVMALRLTEGVALGEFALRWGFDPSDALAPAIAELTREGLLASGKGRLWLTPRGILFSNEVFTRLA